MKLLKPMLSKVRFLVDDRSKPVIWFYDINLTNWLSHNNEQTKYYSELTVAPPDSPDPI